MTKSLKRFEEEAEMLTITPEFTGLIVSRETFLKQKDGFLYSWVPEEGEPLTLPLHFSLWVPKDRGYVIIGGKYIKTVSL